MGANRDTIRGVALLQTVLHHADLVGVEVLRAVVDPGIVVVTIRRRDDILNVMASVDAALGREPDPYGWVDRDGWQETREAIDGVYLRFASPKTERRAASRR